MQSLTSKMLYPEAHLNRNAFPMDFRSIFSAKVGLKLPAFVRHSVPKGVYELDVQGLVRADEMQTASFARMNPNLDFYFVPYTQLFRRFYDIYNARSDEQRQSEVPTSMDISNIPQGLPYFSLPDVLSAIFALWIYEGAYTEMKDSRSVLYNLRTVYFKEYVQRSSGGMDYNGKTWECTFQGSIGDAQSIVPSQMFDEQTDIFGNLSAEDRLRLLDMLGYGNWLPVFKDVLSLFCSAVFHYASSNDAELSSSGGNVQIAIGAGSQSSSRDMVTISYTTDEYPSGRSVSVPLSLGYFNDSTQSGYPIHVNDNYDASLRAKFKKSVLDIDDFIANYFSLVSSDVYKQFPNSQTHFFEYYLMTTGLVNVDALVGSMTLDYASWHEQCYVTDCGGYVNIFPLLAYQKIWSDYGRNAFIDNEVDYSKCFNVDWFDDSHTMVMIKPFDFLQLYVMPRYDTWRKDIFTGALPNAQFGDVAVAGLINPTTITNIAPPSSGTSAYVAGVSSVLHPGDLGFAGQNASYDWNINSGVSVTELRYASALQRYRENIMRAGSRTKDLLRAQFGVVSKFVEDEYCVYLGSFDGSVNVEQVVATNNNEETNIGQIGSYGIGSLAGKKLTVNTSDFGIIIGIFSLIPRAEYENFGIDEHNLKLGQFDYWHSEFENLGLQSVLKHQFDVMSPLDNERVVDTSNDIVIGYSARYHEYKTQLDKVHGEFYRLSPLSQLPVPFRSGSFSDFVSPRPYTDYSTLDLANIYINPNVLDSIFLKAQGPDQASDHFKVALGFSETDVLPMSVTGLPHSV